MDLRLTDIAGYIGVSRPTLYRYLGLYESGSRSQIPKEVLNLFRYIDRTKNVTHDMVMVYLVTNFAKCSAGGPKAEVQKYISEACDDDPKLLLMAALAHSDAADTVVPYLTECLDLLGKEELTDNERNQVARFLSFSERVSRNVPLNDDEKKTLE